MSNEIALLNKDIKRFKGVVADLSKENKKLKEKLEKIKEVLSFCYSEEGTEIPCIDCKYYKECGIQPVDYVIKIASEGLKDE